MSGWNDVGKEQSGGGGRFIRFEEGKVVRVRVLDEEPFTTFVHKVSQPTGPNGEDVFRTIPATDDPDDDFITANTNRYPSTAQHNLRCFVYEEGTDGEGEFKVLQGGPQIFKQLKSLYERYKDIRKFDIEIMPEGKERERKYLVTAAPTSFDIDVEEAIKQMGEDEAMTLEALKPSVTAEDQKRMFKEANFDVAYDPAAEIAEGMSLDEAKDVNVEFGKHKGRTVGELMLLDSGYLKWGAENINTNDRVAAACRVAYAHLGQLEAPAKPKAALKSGAKAAPKAAKKEAAPKNDGAREALVAQVTEAIGANQKFRDDPMELVNFIKKAGNGKTRVKDLNIEELTALHEAVS